MTTPPDLLPSLPGRATPEGTARFRQRFTHFDPGFFHKALGLDISSIGLGTYLGEPDDETDRAYGSAVRLAPTLGCNVIDTAINYRCQFSERVIGRALRKLVECGAVQRDEMLICTKGGYLSFDGPPDNPRAWVDATFIRPGIIDWADIVAYNVMHPGYIRHELEQSLVNLGLGTIDVYYLHNPEAQLQGVSRATFLDRMAACFEELERAAAEGLIGVYGTATWDGFRADPSAPGFVALGDLVRTAEKAGGASHRFRAIQLPFNLAMSEAFSYANQQVNEERVPPLAAAAAFGLAVFASGSLMQGRLTALPPGVADAWPGLASDAQRALQFVRSSPGVGSALVGMKSPDHVRENLALALRPPLPAETVAGSVR